MVYIHIISNGVYGAYAEGLLYSKISYNGKNNNYQLLYLLLAYSY